MSYETTQFYNIATSVINNLALIVNILGIYLLKAARLGSSVQTQIMVSVSCCDILISTATFIVMMLNFYGHTLGTSKMAQVAWAHRMGVYHTWFIMFYLLATGRFLGCNFPFRYRAIVTPRKCKIVIGVSWMIAIILWLVFSILETTEIKAFYHRYYLWLVCDAVFLFFFIVTYASVFYRKKQSTMRFHKTNSRTANRRLFASTTTILVAFILLETIPTIGGAIVERVQPPEFFQHIFELCWNTNLLVDPFIYIFLMPRVRATAVHKFRSLCRIFGRNRAAVAPTNNSAFTISPKVVHITKAEEQKSRNDKSRDRRK